MKKSTLALSVAAVIGGLGFVSNALAIGQITGSPAGSVLVANPDGIGHQLVFPYFTAQSDNATLLTLTNTDLTNGKVVKVRFRGAANSDDLYDFTLLMSPGDVWTAAVSKDATGVAKLVSTDTSCVLPATAKNGLFSTGRVDGTLTGDALNNQTREGYIEVLNMADIPNFTNATAAVDTLFDAVKHVSGVAPCTAAILDAKLGVDYATNAAATTAAIAAGNGEMANPTGGLTGDWVILNQLNTATWSGAATALEVRNAGVRAAGNLVFWPQKFGVPINPSVNATAGLAVVTAASLNNATADALLTNGVVTVQNYDLPDLSTPYADPTAIADANASARADATTATLAIKSLKHQFVTDTAIGAVTDVMFAQPTRRYSVGVNYKAAAAANNNITTTGALAAAVYRGLGANTNGTNATYYTAANTAMFTRQVCLNTVNAPGLVAAQNGLFDREETTPAVGTTSFIISPNVPSAATVLAICGEAAVVSINQGTAAATAALSSTVANRSDVTFAAGYTNGWASWDVSNGVLGYPILSSAFMRMHNGTVNYGVAYPAKVTR